MANRSVGVQSCPTQPRPAAPPCAAPTRPARGMSGFWTRQVGLHMVSFVRASDKMSSAVVFGALGGKWTVGSWAHRPAAVLSRPAPPSPAPPRSALPLCVASPRPWFVWVLDSTNLGFG